MTDEEREELDSVLEGGRLMRRLIESAPWQKLRELVENHIVAMERSFLQPLNSMEQMIAAERQKGTIQGMRLLLSIPQSTVEEMERLLEKMEKEPDDG